MTTHRYLFSSLLTAIFILDAISVSAQEGRVNDDEPSEVIVTGTRFTNPNIVSSSPVTTIDDSAFDRIGAVDAVDVLTRLPSITAAQDSNVNNNATGTSTINLRGLGAERNLILLNGKRLGPGTPTDISADINQIPTPLLERVDVVTGGASAVYGSDAISGVTNFVLNRDFDGLEFDGIVGFFQDGNDSDFAQDVLELTATDGVVPTSSETDGFTFDVSAVYGTEFGDGRGHITAFGRYVDQNSVEQGTRDVSRCALVPPPPGFPVDGFCAGSFAGPFPTTLSLPGVFETDGDGNTVPLAGSFLSLDEAGNLMLDEDGNDLGSGNPFNFNPDNVFLRATERIQGGVFANYEFAPNVEAYLDATYFRNETDAQFAASATFDTVAEINCNNPFLSPELVQVICTDRGFDISENASAFINRRFVESGPRNTEFELENIRLVGGVKGQINDSNWDYDVFGQYATTNSSSENTNDAEIALLTEALLVVDGPNGPECSSGREGCIPLNLFGTEPVDTDALAAILTPTSSTGEVNQLVFGATTQGHFDQLVSPYAATPAHLLLGVEYRRDRLVNQPDEILLQGAATGLGGPLDPVDAASDVIEIFGEANIALVEERPFFENLSLTGQFRFSDYTYDNDLEGGAQSDGFTTTAFSVGASWSPSDDIRIRGQFQRAVRAPNIFELFAPTSAQLFFDTDPCSGAMPAATQEQCELTGLAPELFGFVPLDSGQLLQETSGNTDLQPERSNTFTIGFVLTPAAIEGLTLSIDYYDISIDDFISEISSSSVLNGCLDGSQPDFCGFINRDELGTLAINGSIEASLLNIAERSTQGFDVALNYDFELGAFGGYNFNYTSTIVTALEQVNFPGAPVTDSLGLFGGATFTQQPNPAYRHNANLGWSYNDYGLNIGWRYLGGTQIDGDLPLGIFGSEFDPESYIDLSGQWSVSETVELRFGVNNLFDNDPPLTAFFIDGVSGNTFPSTFDAFGRYIFFGGKLRL